MPSLLRKSILVLVLPATLALAAAPADAITVSGKLKGAKGYTLNGTTADGSTVSKRLSAKGTFKLRFKKRTGRGATLHLIRRDGRYFGPVVLAHKGRKSYLALAGRSVRLGGLRLRKGYAVPRKRIARRAFSRRGVPADKRGKPRGAGKLGIVRSRAQAGALVRSAGSGEGRRPGGADAAGADPDRDGLPSSYDGDDDGDLVLDGADGSSPSSSAGLFTTLFLGFRETLNANAGSTPAQIDPVISGENRFNMIFFFGGPPNGGSAASAHVDCFALSYCRRGDGTGILGGVSESSPSLPRNSPWVDYDPDGSGYPNLERIDRFGGQDEPVFVAGVQPRATTAQIRPGDTFNVAFATGSGPVIVPTTLASYFVTTPALTSYSSGGATTQVSYPIAPGTPGDGSGNPIVMQSERLTLTFWRPQRLSIRGVERGTFTDMGHLHYGVTPGGLSQEVSCAGSYSNLSPTLTAEPSTGVSPSQGAKLFPLADSADDAAPDAARTLSFSVDIGACLRAAGLDPAGRTVELTLTAAGESRPGGQDRGAQNIAVRLPG
jgi:hypothetical protein